MAGTHATEDPFADELIYRKQQAVYAGSRGPDAREVLWEHAAALRPPTGLEVGAGEGGLCERLHRGGTRMAAVDASPRMARLCTERGVPCAVARLPRLPFAPMTFDLVVAAWVLHYLPRELVRPALAELVRVLRPGGTLLLATNADRHMEELWRRLPSARYSLTFPAERAVEDLAAVGMAAVAEEVEGDVVFDDYAQAHGFVARQVRPPEAADRLARFEGPLAVTRRAAVIRARRAPADRRASAPSPGSATTGQQD